MWDTSWSGDLRRLRGVDERIHAVTRHRAKSDRRHTLGAIRAASPTALLDQGELCRDQILALIEQADRRTVSDLLANYARETAS